MRLAYVLLPEPQLPVRRAFLAELQRGDPDSDIRLMDPESPVSGAAEADNAEAIGCSYGDGDRLHVALLRVPFPDGEAEANAEFSIGPDALPFGHRAHLAVGYVAHDSSSPPVQLRRFTRVLASILRCTTAEAVYWGGAGATHSRRFFLDVADSKESLWPMLWTGIKRSREEGDRVSLMTLGLLQWGIPELLLAGPGEKVEELIWFALDLFNHALERGSPIPDGDTTGRSTDERLEVRHVTLPLDSTARVWRIDVPD